MYYIVSYWKLENILDYGKKMTGKILTAEHDYDTAVANGFHATLEVVYENGTKEFLRYC